MTTPALDAAPRDRRDVAIAMAREALWDAVVQIQYLHEKFKPTGSGEAVLARCRAAMTRIDELLR